MNMLEHFHFVYQKYANIQDTCIQNTTYQWINASVWVYQIHTEYLIDILFEYPIHTQQLQWEYHLSTIWVLLRYYTSTTKVLFEYSMNNL